MREVGIEVANWKLGHQVMIEAGVEAMVRV